MTEWFEEWFGEEYLQLYPHRNDTDAGRLVTLLAAQVPVRPGWRVLDVGCGAGRHLSAFERLGIRPFGFDLSTALLRRARHSTASPLIRADMRAIPVRGASMDLTVNLFTSFGYFAEDEEHTDALGQMLATVRPGGWFAIDFLNAVQVADALVPEERATVGGREVFITRRLSPDERFVVKTISLADGRTFMERVRLLQASDLEQMLGSHGADVAGSFGDYDGGPLAGGARTILTARIPG